MDFFLVRNSSTRRSSNPLSWRREFRRRRSLRSDRRGMSWIMGTQTFPKTQCTFFDAKHLVLLRDWGFQFTKSGQNFNKCVVIDDGDSRNVGFNVGRCASVEKRVELFGHKRSTEFNVSLLLLLLFDWMNEMRRLAYNIISKHRREFRPQLQVCLRETIWIIWPATSNQTQCNFFYWLIN